MKERSNRHRLGVDQLIDQALAHEELRGAGHSAKDEPAGLRTDLGLGFSQPFAPAGQAIQHVVHWINIQLLVMLAR